MHTGPIISGKAQVAAVLGWPVTHSLSPALHNHWLARHGVDGVYLPLAVRPEDLGQVLPAMAKMGFRGCNLTLPHKVIAYDLVDERDEAAKRIGAVNVIVFDPQRGLVGSNSDGFGFLANLDYHAPAWRERDGAALVIGAGGAARAVIVALQSATRHPIYLVNRTREKAEALADALASGGLVTVIEWDDVADILPDCALVVNSSSLGMVGQPSLDLVLDRLPVGALVSDIVYTPLETPLLAQARRRGHPVVDGLGMLLFQAQPAFHAWFGHKPAVDDELRRAVLAAKAAQS